MTTPEAREALREASSDLPPRIVVGKNGAYWRDYGDHYSMTVVSTDNDPVEIVAIYNRQEADATAWDRGFAAGREVALTPAPPSGHDWRDHSSSPHHHDGDDPEPIWDRPEVAPPSTQHIAEAAYNAGFDDGAAPPSGLDRWNVQAFIEYLESTHRMGGAMLLRDYIAEDAARLSEPTETEP